VRDHDAISKEEGDKRESDEPSPSTSQKFPDTSLPFSSRILPKDLCLGGVTCISRILIRKGASSLKNDASISGSLFGVGTTNSVKAICAAVLGGENASMRKQIVDGDVRTALNM
jgi:hypothetical protein